MNALDPSLRHRPLLPWSVAGVCFTLVSVALLRTVTTDPAAGLQGHVYEDAAVAVVWLVAGALLAPRPRGRRFGRLFLLIAASGALSLAAGAVALMPGPEPRAATVWAAWLAGWSWTASTFLPVTLVPLWFPDGATTRFQRGLGRVAVAAVALMTLGLATAPTIELTVDRSIENPIALPFSDVGYLTGMLLTALTALAAVTVLITRLRAAGEEARSRLVPVTVAVVVALGALTVAGLLDTWGPLIQLLAMPLIPITVVLVVLRHRMYGLEIFVRRAVVLAGLTVLVVGGYVLVVEAAAALLHRHAGLAESVLATGVVALAFQPARVWLQRLVARRLYGERDTPLQAVTDVGQALVIAADPLTALGNGVERLRVALRSPWAQITGPAGPMASAGREPASPGASYSVELRHLDQACGQLTVAQRGPREPFVGRDLDLLDRLVAPLAAAVAAQLTLDEIRLSRERAVVAREEERRRVRRELHDGVGPLLAALTLHLDVLSLRGPPDGKDTELLARARAIGAETVQALRGVIDDLEPAAVDDLGLTGALTELAASFTVADQVVVTVAAGELAGLSAAAELAAYRICAEAITNAVRHGSPREVRVELTCDPSGLRVDVVDDGTGFVGAPGFGLTSMRERAAELGGTIEVRSGPGGTRVAAHLPRRTGGLR